MGFKATYLNGVTEDAKRTWHYILDSEADVANLPESAVEGSTAETADGTKEWTKSPSGVWTLKV